MFIDKAERPQGEVKPMKLSEAIRLGAAMDIPENQTWSGCAIGTALKAVGAYPQHAYFLAAHSTFGVPISVLTGVSLRHSEGTPRLQLANELEKMGY